MMDKISEWFTMCKLFRPHFKLVIWKLKKYILDGSFGCHKLWQNFFLPQKKDKMSHAFVMRKTVTQINLLTKKSFKNKIEEASNLSQLDGTLFNNYQSNR